MKRISHTRPLKCLSTFRKQNSVDQLVDILDSLIILNLPTSSQDRGEFRPRSKTALNEVASLHRVGLGSAEAAECFGTCFKCLAPTLRCRVDGFDTSKPVLETQLSPDEIGCEASRFTIGERRFGGITEPLNCLKPSHTLLLPFERLSDGCEKLKVKSTRGLRALSGVPWPGGLRFVFNDSRNGFSLEVGRQGCEAQRDSFVLWKHLSLSNSIQLGSQ